MWWFISSDPGRNRKRKALAVDPDTLQNRPRVRPDTFERWIALLAGLGIFALVAVELLFGGAE